MNPLIQKEKEKESEKVAGAGNQTDRSICVRSKQFIELDVGGWTIFQVPAFWPHSMPLRWLGRWDESNSFHYAGCGLLCNTVPTAGITPHVTGAGQL